MQLAIAALILASSLAAVVMAPIGTLRRRPGAARRWLAAGLGAANAAFLVGFPVLMAATLADPSAILYGIPTPVAALLALPLVSAVLTAPTAVAAVRALRRPAERVTTRAGYSLFTIVSVGYLAWLACWHLLGWQP
ncbi:hypothetical protein [Rhizomonospora bruguierae]|uniref:hypothetical protein n=1 Tax=Rhizomonospora bruguierae TaxID=1581705 RepID=UPI001BCAC224|nr:hypothetical protein [Micromonospora sp. NBRC 107566]